MKDWRSTLLGFLLGVVYYLSQSGVKMPETKQDWWNLAVSCSAAGLGWVVKDKAAKKVLPLALLILVLGGCAGTAAVIEALAKDQATVCFTNVNPWSGTTTFARTNIKEGDVTCDKLQVRSPGSTTVPVTVVPVVK